MRWLIFLVNDVHVLLNEVASCRLSLATTRPSILCGFVRIIVSTPNANFFFVGRFGYL